MKRNPYYQLRYMADVPYLVTFGQGHADFLRDLQLNETGVFLWEHSEDAQTTEQLAKLCLEHFHCSAAQRTTLQHDVKAFVDGLFSRGILLSESPEIPCTFPRKTLEIAGLSCCIHAPADLFSPEMLAFEDTDSKVLSTPTQNIYTVTTIPSFTPNGRVLVRNTELTILESDKEYILLFTSFSKVKEAHIRTDGLLATLYCHSDISGEDKSEFSYAVRILYFYFALQHGILALHSASILYKDKLWLFSAPSGTGKSTHAQLWKDLYETPIINGDINLITLEQGTPMVCGNPWHGTSGIYATEKYPLGGVLLLRQGENDNVQALSEDRKELFLLHRCISPTWTPELLDKNHLIIQNIGSQIFVATLTCTQNPSAVHCCKETIDRYTEKK